MKIKTKAYGEKFLAEYDEDIRQFYSISIDGKTVFYYNDEGTPEDRVLYRDLKFMYDIVPMLKKAYMAGLRKEKLIIEEDKLSEYILDPWR